jgi:hypothetical protein
MEKPEQNQSGNMNCGVDHGSLPGCCASLAFPFVPMQEPNPVRYSRMEALQTGTLFPGLDLPFKAAIQANSKLNNTALVELMALDFAIDEINDSLNSIYPTFSELLAENPEAKEYAYFPDRYIRRAVISGAAWNYYVVDEEGLQTSLQYQVDFEKGKFIMQRDMLYNIPKEYQAPLSHGYVIGDRSNDTVGERGIEVDLDF